MNQRHIIVAATLLALPACKMSEPAPSAPTTTATDDGATEHTTKNGDTMGPENQSPPNKPDVPQNSSY